MTTYCFLSRVPKSCPHGITMQTTYEVENPNTVPDASDALEHDRHYRNVMMARGTDRDLTGNLDDWPDYYIVTRCNRCDANRVNEWNEAHWDKSPWERQLRFVKTLVAYECPNTLTDDNKADVLLFVERYHLTRYDFKSVDENPARYHGDLDDWLWKLRQVRNSNTRLYDILNNNEQLGYKDINQVPPISLVLYNMD